MGNLQKVVYLTEAQKDTLFTNGTITVDGVTITYSADDLYVTPTNDEVLDVQLNGTSVVDANGVANVPVASASAFGTVKINEGNGVTILSDNGTLSINTAADAQIQSPYGINTARRPITPSNQHKAVFYGLAKAAGTSVMESSSNAVGIYTPEAKAAIWNMLGLDGSAFVQSEWELIREDTFTNATEADHEITLDGNGNSFELTDAILLFETPQQTTYSAKGSTGHLWFYYDSSNYISSECGSWTQDENAAAHTCGAELIQNNGMVRMTIISSNTGGAKAIRYSRIYPGLASSGTVGAYRITNDPMIFSKINIKSVTGTGHYKLYGKRKKTGLDSPVINVSGTTPTITALPGHRYICGEVSTLSITVPSSGIIDVTFDSGSTPTVLTVTPPTGMTMRWIGDDPTALEANKHYEINIADGCNGMVVSWT